MSDPNVSAVRAKLRDRERTGLRKYGVTTERTDLSFLEWLNHFQQELLDGAVYAEKMIRVIEERAAVEGANPHYIPTPAQLALDAEVARRKAKKATGKTL